MDWQHHYRCLEHMYHSAPINNTLPSQLEVYDGGARITLTVGPHLWHSAGGLHGSLYFKGLDDAAFFAANAIEPVHFVLTAKFEVELLAIVSSSPLFAEGIVERREGRRIWASSVLRSSDQELVARGNGLFVVSRTRLSAELGYRTH